MVGALGIEPVVGFRTENFELVRCLVARGFGYGMLFQRPSIDLTYDGRRLVSRPITEQIPSTAIVMAQLAGNRLTERALRFRDFSVAEFAQPPGGAP